MSYAGCQCAVRGMTDALGKNWLIESGQTLQSSSCQANQMRNNLTSTDTVKCTTPGPPNSTGSISLTTARATTSWATLAPTANFRLILQNNTEVRAEPGIDVYNIDIDSSRATFDSLLEAKKFIVCHFSAGTSEVWQEDVGCFNHKPEAQDYGYNLGGEWPDEFWLNTTSFEVRKTMQTRIQYAEDRGCNAIDPDNIDSYSNDNSIGAAKQDSINFIKFLSAEARFRGMGIALKNSLEIIPDVIEYLDFGVNESCNEFDECNLYEPFCALSESFPVFNIEYPRHNGKTWTEKDAEKKYKPSLTLNYTYVHTDLKNYPTVDCGISRCTTNGPVPAVVNGSLVIPSGCVTVKN